MTGSRLVRAVAWRRLDVLGTEVCRLSARDDGGWEVDGTALILRCNQPLREVLRVIYRPAKISMEAWIVSYAYNNSVIISSHYRIQL